MVSEKELQRLFNKHYWDRYDLLAKNTYINWQYNEMDLLGIRKSGYIDEIEIKITLFDYKKDFKKSLKIRDESKNYESYIEKPKHEAIESGIAPCNYFSFLVPEGLVNEDDVPGYAGLYVYYKDRLNRGRIKKEKSPILLHKRKLDVETKYSIAKKMARRYWRDK